LSIHEQGPQRALPRGSALPAAKTESLARIARPLTFDYLMEAIQTGQDKSESLQQRLKDLRDQRDQVVREHIEQIKLALGDSRFEKLDTFVRAPQPARLPPGIKAQ
jgi:hypothetical protein